MMLLRNFIIFTIAMYVGGLIFMYLEADEVKRLLSPKHEISNLKQMITSKSNLSRQEVEFLFRRMEKAIKENGVKEPYTWDYYESCFFVGSLLTTIGYGNISPRTSSGRGVAIFFSLFGIPLTVLVVRNISTKLTNSVVKIVRFFYKAKENVNNIAANQEKRLSLGISPRLRSKIKEWKISDKRKAKRGIYRFSSSDRKTKIACIVVLLFMVILFLLVSAGLRVLSEGWTMYESIYFWFITLTTVGFGDFVPYEGRKPSSVAATVIYYSGTFYLLIGLALIASLIQCISVMLEGRLPAVASSDNENKSKEISDSKPVELPDGTQNPAPHTRFSQIFIENVEQCDRINTNGAKSTGQNISHAVLESSTALFSFFVPSRHSNSGQGKTEDPQ